MTKLQNFGDLNLAAEFDDGKFPQRESSFPLHFFPDSLRSLIQDADKKGHIPDLLAGAMLGTVSGALGSNFKLKTDDQKPALWIVLVAPSGIGKTPALNLAIKPLRERDQQLRAEGSIPYSQIVNTSPKKGESEHQKGLIISDFTPEVLTLMHAMRPRGVCVVHNELSQLFEQIGRYNKKRTENQIFMNMWDASGPVSSDRVKGSLTIDTPYLPVLGTIQPSEARRIFEDGRGLNGFSHRMLFIYLPDLKKKVRSTDTLNEVLTKDWHKAITKLVDLSDDEQFEVKLSAGANSVYCDFVNERNLHLYNDNIQSELGGMHSKYDIHVLRIAFVLQALKWAYSSDEQFFTEIETQTMENAIELGEYFRKNALQVIGDGLAGTPDAKSKIEKLYDLLPEDFERRDALEKGLTLGIHERTVDTYLQDTTYFQKVIHGKYKKK